LENQNAEIQNQKFWDEVAPVHLKSYNIKDLKKGVSHIDAIQQKEFYPVKDKDLLHLQCHIGTDSISLAYAGANVTAVDFSKESITIARQLNKEIGTNVLYIHSNVYDLKDNLDKKFDVVYTSKGVLSWLKDLNQWANIVAHFLKDGGLFYLMDIHPLSYMFDDTIAEELKIKYSYFNSNSPMLWDDDFPDYSDKNYIPKNETYEWTWAISDILNALISAGLKIEFFNEHDKLFYNGLAGMKRDETGWWFLEKYENKIPLTFSLLAKK